MEHFHDGHHVWLRSRVRGMYLHADEDGRGVSLHARRASRNAAWRVHLFCQGGGCTSSSVAGAPLLPARMEQLMLLQGAAYGRYLAATNEPARTGHLGLRAEQRDLHEPERQAIAWQGVRSGFQEDVLLLHMSVRGFRFLRANGRYRQWQRGVTVDETNNISTMMHWVVEPIPRRDTIPPLPGSRQRHGILGVLLGQRIEEEEERWREVRYVRAGPDGLVNEDDWVAFQFAGRSVANLRSELALRLGETVVGFTMCVRAGRYAQLTPLFVDLPLGDETLDIVILMAGSPAIDDLQHPDVHAA